MRKNLRSLAVLLLATSPGTTLLLVVLLWPRYEELAIGLTIGTLYGWFVHPALINWLLSERST